MYRPRRERLKGQSFNKMIPNILTMLALCAGLTALRFGIEGKWEPAVLSLVVAAILDALDGRIARLLKGTSKFGAELDSLSDFIGFGVAPALLLYLWTMKDAGPVGWCLSCCSASVAPSGWLGSIRILMDPSCPPGPKTISPVFRHPPGQAWCFCLS